MDEYKEGENAFWNGKPQQDNPYCAGDDAYSFRQWNLGYLYAKSMSHAREDEIG